MALGGGELANVASFLQAPADKYGNDETLEFQWAMKAFQHAETYFNLITAVDTTILRLTKMDEEIYTQFRKDFPDFGVKDLNEDEMKSTEGKAKWREFCTAFEGQVEDWNMGTLLRLDCTQDVSEQNTTLVPRIQFLAIEIARNKEGLNLSVREKFAKKKVDTTKEGTS